MARAFKDFRNELKQRKESERQAEREREAEAQRIDRYIDGLKKGAKVQYSIFVNAFSGKPIISSGFFAGDTDGAYIWIADTKADALSGYGRTISKSDLII
jgi:hypothetical protein